MNHTHQCGFEDDAMDPEKGCGHTWSHEDSCIFLPQREFEAAHMCPKCGNGPWTEKVDSERGSLIIALLGELDG